MTHLPVASSPPGTASTRNIQYLSHPATRGIGYRSAGHPLRLHVPPTEFLVTTRAYYTRENTLLTSRDRGVGRPSLLDSLPAAPAR